MSTSPRPAVTPQAVAGVSICLMGIALTLDNLGLYQLRSLIELWPLVPVSIGILTLMYADGRQEWIKGTFWLALGIFFIFRHPLMHQVWPLVLVALGGYLVWRSRTGPPPARRWEDVPIERDPGVTDAVSSERLTPPPIPKNPFQNPPFPNAPSPNPDAPGHPPPPVPHAYQQERPRHRGFGCGGGKGMPPPPPPPPGFGGRASERSASEGEADSNQFPFAGFAPAKEQARPRAGKPYRPSLFALMSGVRRQVTGGFAGAETTAIMGGVELDLRYSAMEGDEVTIDTFALWGGIEIWVPTHWEVVSQGLPLMGAFEDKTRVTTHGAHQPRLIIRGVAIMGGVEIKN